MLQFMGSQRVRHDLMTEQQQDTEYVVNIYGCKNKDLDAPKRYPLSNIQN